MLLPKRVSLVAQAVDILKKQIEIGELSEFLPGERALASKLEIGRDTLRASLLELEQVGWVGESKQGRKRQILKVGSRIEPKAREGYCVGFLAPKDLRSMSPESLVELDELRGLFEEQGVTMEVRSPAVFDLKRPSMRLREMVKSFPADLWVLYQGNEHIQRWFEKEKIPCIVRGYAQEKAVIPQVGEDYFAVGLHGGTHLVRLGHREMALVVPDSGLSCFTAAENGLRKALSFPNVKGRLRVVEEEQTNDSLIKVVKEILESAEPPTVLVLTRPRQVLTVITWLASQGKIIPRDLSLLALCHDPCFAHLIPQVTHYEDTTESIAGILAQQVQSILETGQAGRKAAMVFPELVPGGSVRSLGENL